MTPVPFIHHYKIDKQGDAFIGQCNEHGEPEGLVRIIVKNTGCIEEGTKVNSRWVKKCIAYTGNTLSIGM